MLFLTFGSNHLIKTNEFTLLIINTLQILSHNLLNNSIYKQILSLSVN